VRSWLLCLRSFLAAHPLTLRSLPRCSDALRSARGTLADAGGSSAAALASGGRAAAAVAAAPFTFASAGVRLTVAGISVLKDDVGAVRAFAATA
jgi:hypothetical protein